MQSVEYARHPSGAESRTRVEVRGQWSTLAETSQSHGHGLMAHWQMASIIQYQQASSFPLKKLNTTATTVSAGRFHRASVEQRLQGGKCKRMVHRFKSKSFVGEIVEKRM